MEGKLQYRSRVITDSEVVFIRQLLREHPAASRRELSKKLCQAWNWVQPNGALRDMVCRGLMLKLHREGLIELPSVRQVPCNPLAHRSQPTVVSVDARPLQVKLSEIQPLEFRSVRSTQEEQLFRLLNSGSSGVRRTQRTANGLISLHGEGSGIQRRES